MNESHIRNVIEAALLAAGRPLQPVELIELFDEGARPQVQDIHAALAALAAEYSSRGIEIKETAAGFRIQVRRELANEISRLWPERPARYSRALLETLALIAYRQPITRAEIEAVRGVGVNPNILKTVIERNWVRVVGHRDVPGRPELLGTTREFLDYFGLKSLDELPPLVELKALGDIKVQFELPDAGPVGVPGVELLAGPDGAVGADGGAGAADPNGGVAGDVVAQDGAGEGGAERATSSVVAADGAAKGADGVVAGSADGAAYGAAEGEPAAAARLSGADDGDAGDSTAKGAAARLSVANDDDAGRDGAGAVADAVATGAAAKGDGGAVAKFTAGGDAGVDASDANDADVRPHDASDGAAIGDLVESADGDGKHAPVGSAQNEAKKFAASIEADLAAGDDDSADDDELSASGPGSSEWVAGPRSLDD
jgi:segregation and condensation protein B